MTDLTPLLGRAYSDVFAYNRSRPIVVKELSEGIAALDADAVRAEHARLGAVVKARPGACHITKEQYDLLTEAMAL